MAIYAVHSPALDGDPAAAFDRARTLRQGFAFWALVFGPAWLLFKGLWLALATWILGAVLVGLAIGAGFLPPGAGVALYWLASLFLGIEGRAMQGRALARNGRPLADIVGGADADDAARGFLARALKNPAPLPTRASVPPASGPPQVLGLFPEAGR